MTLPCDMERLVLTLMEDLACPRSLTVAILVRHSEWHQLVHLECRPEDHQSDDSYHRAAIATGLLMKCSELDTGIDKKQAALKKFWEAEALCYQTNQRLSPYLYHSGKPASDQDWARRRVLAALRKEIARILGPLPRALKGRFGPGSTFGDRGRLTTVADKLQSTPTTTRLDYLVHLQWFGSAWSRSLQAGRCNSIDVVRGNRFLTVPKNAKTDRSIAVEPSLNVFYQLALGSAVRQRLKAYGIDLDTGQDLHREMARESSISGACATIDLSMASDTVSSNLVKLLVPRAWLELLESLRSPMTLIEGRWYRLEKFSSMGNGFTFELETLIFTAAVKVACDMSMVKALPGVDFSCYGDDLICPAPAVRNLKNILAFLGFKINPEKSFVEGPFRESCGEDFYNGTAVRPHFIKEFPREPQEWITFANGLRRRAWPYAIRTWHRSLDHIPYDIRCCRGPRDLGDIVIWDHIDMWLVKWKGSIRYVKCYKALPSRVVPWTHFNSHTKLAYALYTAGSRPFPGADPNDGVTPRDAVSGFRTGWVPYS